MKSQLSVRIELPVNSGNENHCACTRAVGVHYGIEVMGMDQSCCVLGFVQQPSAAIEPDPSHSGVFRQALRQCIGQSRVNVSRKREFHAVRTETKPVGLAEERSRGLEENRAGCNA